MFNSGAADVNLRGNIAEFNPFAPDARYNIYMCARFRELFQFNARVVSVDVSRFFYCKYTKICENTKNVHKCVIFSKIASSFQSLQNFRII